MSQIPSLRRSLENAVANRAASEILRDVRQDKNSCPQSLLMKSSRFVKRYMHENKSKNSDIVVVWETV